MSGPADKWIGIVQTWADAVLRHGRDLYPHQEHLIADGIDPESLTGARVNVAAEVADGLVLSNPACQGRLLRTLVGLSNLTGDSTYNDAAGNVIRHMFSSLSDRNGLLYWGGHVGFDLEHNETVKGKSGPHELKCHYPYYELMWRVDPEATKRYIEAAWNAHIYDWSVLDFSRHGKYDIEMGRLWDHEYRPGRIFFVGRGLTFINCGSDLYYAAGRLHQFTGDDRPLAWAKRLNGRFVETRDPSTGMGGYQFTLRYLKSSPYWTDRAIHQFGGQLAGHFVAEGAISHPRQIWAIVASAGIARMNLGRALGDPGDQFTQSAVEDLVAYGRHAYERDANVFHATHTDGTRLTELVFEEDGYYGPRGKSWRPVPADGAMLRAYATGFVEAGETDAAFLWQMVRDLGKGLGLGELGESPGQSMSLAENTGCSDESAVLALIELHAGTGQAEYLALADRIAANLVNHRLVDELFLRDGVAFVDDPAPLALLHLAAAHQGRPSAVDSYPR